MTQNPIMGMTKYFEGKMRYCFGNYFFSYKLFMLFHFCICTDTNSETLGGMLK